MSGHVVAQFDGKIDSLDRLEKITTDYQEKVDILLELSALSLVDNPDLSVQYAQRASTISGNVGYVLGKATALDRLAAIYREADEFEQALEYLAEAEQLFLTEGDSVGLVETELERALTFQDQGEYDKASAAVDRAMELATVLKNKRLRAFCFVREGSLYFNAGYDKEEEARDSYLMALNMYPDAEKDRRFAEAFANLGTIFLDQEKYDKAKIYVLSAIRVYQYYGEMSPLAALNYNAGVIYRNESNYETAKTYFLNSLSLAQATNNTDYRIDSYEQLAETYADMGDFQNAYVYLTYFASTKGSRFESVMEARAEAASNRLIVQERNREEERLQAEIEGQELLLYGLLIGFGCVAILTVVLIRLVRQKNTVNRELKAAKEKAESSEHEKEKFLAYTSHEIRTPLNGLLGMISLLKKTPITAAQDRYISAIKNSSDNILIIANDILDLTKIDSGKIEFESINFMLMELVDELVYMLQVKAQAKGLVLKARYDDDLPNVVVGDPLRLSQILMNLINNAIKFTEKGEVSVNVHGLKKSEGNIRVGFTVSDTGIGIKKDKLAAVFNRFEQEDKDTTRKYGGAGLGLSITKQLVELQGGSISVRSRYGEGSVFSVRLNFPVGMAGAVVEKINAPLVDPNKIADIKILLVDDNLLNRTILTDLLRDWHPRLHIDQAEDGRVAIQHLEKKTYDVVLMDIQMPRMNGYQASNYIRTKMPAPQCDVPIIAMSAHALSGIADKIKETGMNDYVSKPIDMEQLIERFTKLIPPTTLFAKAKPASQKRKNYQTINLDHLRKLTNNDESKIEKYIDIFLKNLKEDRQTLQKNIQEKNWEGLGKVAHKMKGTTSYMGIKELETIFANAQHYNSKDVVPEDIDAVLQRIEELCDAAIAELLEVKETL